MSLALGEYLGILYSEFRGRRFRIGYRNSGYWLAQVNLQLQEQLQELWVLIGLGKMVGSGLGIGAPDTKSVQVKSSWYLNKLTVIHLGVHHISTYQLTVERGTLLHKQVYFTQPQILFLMNLKIVLPRFIKFSSLEAYSN